MENKKIFVFDLDGTLALSKSPIDDEMSSLLSSLLSKKMVAIISGGGFKQFQTQVIGKLSKNTDFNNLYVFPTKGGAMYEHKGGAWQRIYEETLTDQEKNKIRNAVSEALERVDFIPDRSYGEKLEDRNSQFTFSALGQDAPYDIKHSWDPDMSKREVLKKILDGYLPEFSVEIGGSTSIDITRKNIDKAFAIRKIMEILDIKKEEIVFMGDAIFPGGNDYPVVKTGVEAIKVKDAEETKRIISKFLKSWLLSQ